MKKIFRLLLPAFLISGVIIGFIFLPKEKTISLTFNKKKNSYEVKEKKLRIETKKKEIEREDDADNDGKKEKYELKNGTLIIWQNELPRSKLRGILKKSSLSYLLHPSRLNRDGFRRGDNKKKIWQTPSSWRVDSFFLADANNDEAFEINLSVWKKGNFGSSKPFWVKDNDQSLKNHFFIFKLKAGKIEPVWQSSNLNKPNCEFSFGDVDNNRKEELVVIEGEYGLKYNCQGNYLAVWRWNGWGFTNQWRSQKGNYKNLEIKKTAGENLITVEVY